MPGCLNRADAALEKALVRVTRPKPGPATIFGCCDAAFFVTLFAPPHVLARFPLTQPAAVRAARQPP